MSEAWRGAKMDPIKPVHSEVSADSAELAEAIKALQTQLADLRKIVQAAKVPTDGNIEPARRQ